MPAAIRRPTGTTPAPVGSTTLIIATSSRPIYLRKALCGVAQQTRPFEEVLVAVRPDDTASRSVIATTTGLPIREVLVARASAVAARNAAMDVAEGDVVLYLDDDAVPPPEWNQSMVRHFDADARVGAVGGRDRIHHGGELVIGERTGVGMVTRYGRFIGLHHLGTGDARDVFLLKGVNMSVRRQWLPALRFDEELRGRGAEPHEDWALSLAVRGAGYRVVYDPSIWVDHFEADRLGGDARFQPTGRVVADRAFNQTYAGVRYLPRARALAHVAYAVLVGTLNEPGLGQFVRALRAGHAPVSAAAALRHALLARCVAVGCATRRRWADRRRRTDDGRSA